MNNPFRVEWGRRTYLMGVVNVTPDSFSGDGIEEDLAEVMARARLCQTGGADVIDVGGESTRPGHVRVSLAEEMRRVIPAIEAVYSVVTVPISIDTTKAPVAREALRAGASIVNDVSGSADEETLHAVADSGAGLVLVHHGRGAPRDDVVTVVRDGLERQVERARAAGISRNSIVIDPGLGFGKTWRENFYILRRLQELRALELPIMVGPSRKGMIGKVLGVGVADRTEGTLALVSVAIAHGVDIVRVHDVKEMNRAARMMDRLIR